MLGTNDNLFSQLLSFFKLFFISLHPIMHAMEILCLPPGEGGSRHNIYFLNGQNFKFFSKSLVLKLKNRFFQNSQVFCKQTGFYVHFIPPPSPSLSLPSPLSPLQVTKTKLLGLF